MATTLYRAVFLLGLVAVPPLALLGLPATTIVFAVNALAALLVLAPQWRELAAWRPSAVAAVILAALLLGLASALWSILPGESAMRALKLLALALGGFAIVAAARRPGGPRVDEALLAVLVGMVVADGLAMTDKLLLFEVMDDLEPGFVPRRGFYSRGATVMILFAWLAVIGLLRLGRGRLAALIYLGIGLVVAIKFRSGAAATVWVLGGGVFLAWIATKGRARLALAALAAGVCLAMPVLVAALPAPDPLHADRRLLPSSWSHRIVIWQFAAERIAERPILGWGLDASRRMPGARDLIPWQMDPDPADPGDRMSVVQKMPLHPHSIALQLWLELGAAGAALLAALAFLLVSQARIAAAVPGADAALAALASAALAICNVSYGAWQTWWLSTLFLVAAAALVLATRRDPAPGQ